MRTKNQLYKTQTLPNSRIPDTSAPSEQAERLSLPDQIQGVIEKFMSGSEQQLASYRAELTVSQQETLIGTMVSDR